MVFIFLTLILQLIGLNLQVFKRMQRPNSTKANAKLFVNPQITKIKTKFF